MDDVLYKQKVVYSALEELDETLFHMKVKPFELNVIGGFAMTVEQIRMSDYTDIDYIGKDLPESIKSIIDEIGLRYKLGRGWINNDCMLSGTTLEDLECATGKLNFNHAFDLKVITVNTLDVKDLLRMKIIAIDTNYSSLSYGGDFTRVKDFSDVELLMKRLAYSYNDVVTSTFDYVECPEIYFLLRYYLRTHDITSISDSKERMEIISKKGRK